MIKPSSNRKSANAIPKSPLVGSPATAKTVADPGNLTQPPMGVPVGLNSSVVGVSEEERVRKSNLWRDNYNPLRALTISRLLTIFEAAERGAYAELQLVLRKAEKRYPVLKGFIMKLLSSIEELDWDVKIMEQLPEGATPAMADAQKKYLRQRYDLLKNFNHSLGQLALADVRGYAVLQKHRYQDGANAGSVEELYWLEPWCWARDGFYGDFFYNEISRFGVGLGSCASVLGENNRIGSEALPRADFVVRTVDSPIYEIALIAMVNWMMARKDWAAFTEIFGLPNFVVIMPPNITPGREQDYQASAEKVARGVSGALPNGSDVKSPASGERGEHPFESYCEANDKDVVLAGTGGHLTMIAQPTGLGKGGTEEHDDAWQKIAVNKARRINETLQRDFDTPELAAKFPGQPICVYFQMAVKDQEDVAQLMDTVVKADSVGLEADAKEISERTGIKLERVEAEPAVDPIDPLDKENNDQPEPGLAVRNRIVKILNRVGVDQAEQFYQAIAADLKPLRDRLAAIEVIADPALRQSKLSTLYADMDQIAQDIAADPATARALEQINGRALVDGLKGKTPKS